MAKYNVSVLVVLSDSRQIKADDAFIAFSDLTAQLSDNEVIVASYGIVGDLGCGAVALTDEVSFGAFQDDVQNGGYLVFEGYYALNKELAKNSQLG